MCMIAAEPANLIFWSEDAAESGPVMARVNLFQHCLKRAIVDIELRVLQAFCLKRVGRKVVGELAD